MAIPPIPLTCEERSGFLFAHACDRPPVDQCAECAKWVCTEHIRHEGDRFVCVSCHRRQAGPPTKPQERTGEWDYYDYDDDWFDYRWRHWHDYTYYDADDRRVFDRSSGTSESAGGPQEGMSSGGAFGPEGFSSGGGFEADFDAS